MLNECDVVIVGAGAAGIAATIDIERAGRSCLLVEARDRLGGRAFTATESGVARDHGCGWLHSADRNPLVAIATGLGFQVDRSPPPWQRRSNAPNFGADEQADFRRAQAALDQRLEAAAREPRDAPVSTYLEPGNRWNPLIDAVSTYYSGAETTAVSALDLRRYDDSGVNWRVRQGYGRAIAAGARGLPVALGCEVSRIDHRGRRIRVETPKGAIEARAVIVTLPSALLARERIRFDPPLPDKAEAASGLPLGLADKLYFRLEDEEDFAPEERAFGRTDTARTAAYHLRPLGHPLIECYFGGSLADDLEKEGAEAFEAFARDELAGLFGRDRVSRLTALPMHPWRRDPFAGGSYSYAVPGRAENRMRLAEPVDDRLFFAGEACSRHDFSTAHGAWITGRKAAEAALAALDR